MKSYLSFLLVKDWENLDKDETISGVIVYAGIFRNMVRDVLDFALVFVLLKITPRQVAYH